MPEPLLWADWRPDVSDYKAQFSANLENVVPRGDGYGPIRNYLGYTDALPAACRGAFLGVNADGSIAIFAGTATKLYRMDNTDLSWTDVSKAGTSTLTGTPIGTLTGGGGLAAAFDSTTAQAQAACATLAATTSGYVGLTLTVASAITSALVYGSNDAGYISGSNPSVTINMYGKTGTAPSSGTDGTLIGTLTFTDTADESVARTITSTSAVIWDHVWVNVTTAGSVTLGVAELQPKGTGTYSLASDEQWQFAQFNSVIIATNQNDAPQAYTLASSVSFAALAGSPPQGSYVTVVASHLVISGILNNPHRIQWSARDSVVGWTSGTDGSDFQDFPDGGKVMGVAGGEFGVVFQESAIRRMTFLPGSDLIFQFDRIAEGEGLRAPYSVVNAGPRIFFLGTSGFQVISSGSPPENISKERWFRTFLSEWDDSELGLMIGALEPKSSRAWWFYKTSSGTTGNFNRGIVYDWVLDRAVPFNVNGEFAAMLSQPGVTLEGLSALGFTNIDTMTISLDDFAGSSGSLLGVVGTDHKIGFLTGDTLEATLETAEQCFDRRMFVSKVRPLTDATAVMGYVTTRQRLGDPVVKSVESALNAIGFTPHRVDTRQARFGNRIPAASTWSYSIGVEPDLVQTGMR